MLPTPVVLSKEERRLQFAKEVEENDQRKALLQQQQQLLEQQNLNDPTENLFYNTNPNYYYVSNDGSYYNTSSDGYALPIPENNAHQFNQGFYNSNELQASHSSLLEMPETLNMNTGVLPPEINGSTVYPSNVHYQSSHQQVYNFYSFNIC